MSEDQNQEQNQQQDDDTFMIADVISLSVIQDRKQALLKAIEINQDGLNKIAAEIQRLNDEAQKVRNNIIAIDGAVQLCAEFERLASQGASTE